MKRLLLLAFLIIFSGCAAPHKSSFSSPYFDITRLEVGTILHLPTGTSVTREELIDYISGSRVVYVGESHKNIRHHRIQFEVIKALFEESPGELAVGMEMFQRPSQDLIDRWLFGEADDREFFAAWMKNWGLDYDYYREILEYIKENRIPLIALNISRDRLRGSSGGHGAGGGGGATLEDTETLPELDSTDPYHRQWVEAVYTDPNHGKTNFEGFYRIQLLWEETMAETAADYLLSDEGSGKRMVILAGGGHISYGFGIPRRVFRRIPVPYTTILPASTTIMSDRQEGLRKGAEYLEIMMPDLPLYMADFIWATDYETIKNVHPKLGVYLAQEEEDLTVTLVMPKTPAERDGMMSGDIVRSLDGAPIETFYDLVYLLRQKEFDEQVTVTVEREGEVMDIEVTLTRLDSSEESAPTTQSDD